MQFHRFPLTGFTTTAVAGTPVQNPAIDITRLPAGLGGKPAYVAAFVLRCTAPLNFAGGSAAVSYQDLGLIMANLSLQSQTMGNLFGEGGLLTGTDIYNWVAPVMGWGPIDGIHCKCVPQGIGAAAGAVNRIIDFVLPFYDYNLEDPTDGCPPTVAFRGDTIASTLAAQAALGANTTIGAVVCTPYAVLVTKSERRATTVRQWGVHTDPAAAEMVMPARAYSHVAILSNLVGLGGAGALNTATNIQIPRDDLYVGLAQTAEDVLSAFTCGLDIRQGQPTGGSGAANSLAWPYNPAAAVAFTGAQLDPQLLALPVIFQRQRTKLSHISLSGSDLKIQTAGLAAGAQRLLWSAMVPQSQTFARRIAGLYGMGAVQARPKLLRPPRDAARGPKPEKTRLLPVSLFDAKGN